MHIESYLHLPDHTEVKAGVGTLGPVINQQVFNELLLRARFLLCILAHSCARALLTAPQDLSPPLSALCGLPALPGHPRPSLDIFPLHAASPKEETLSFVHLL